MTNDITDDAAEDYCSDCGCVADDEVCPRCRVMIADAQRREGVCHGDRRWNGQAMSRHRMNIDTTILVDIRETP